MRKPNFSINLQPKSPQVFAPFKTACVSVRYKCKKKSVTYCHNYSVFLFLPQVYGTTLNPWTLKKPQTVPVSRTPFPSVSQWEVWNTVQSFARLEDFAHNHATVKDFQIFSWWIFSTKLNFYFDLSKNFLYYDNIKHNRSGRYHKACNVFIRRENVARIVKIKIRL